MAAKIIGFINTLPETIRFDGQVITRDQWIRILMDQHDACASLWCFEAWSNFVIITFKKYGLPVPDKGKLPWLEYSHVLLNDLAHITEI